MVERALISVYDKGGLEELVAALGSLGVEIVSSGGTARRIREMGYEGKYTQVKEAIREIKRLKKEVYMPPNHKPGEAQVDFGYALAKVSG